MLHAPFYAAATKSGGRTAAASVQVEHLVKPSAMLNRRGSSTVSTAKPTNPKVPLPPKLKPQVSNLVHLAASVTEEEAGPGAHSDGKNFNSSSSNTVTQQLSLQAGINLSESKPMSNNNNNLPLKTPSKRSRQDLSNADSSESLAAKFKRPRHEDSDSRFLHNLDQFRDRMSEKLRGFESNLSRLEDIDMENYSEGESDTEVGGPNSKRQATAPQEKLLVISDARWVVPVSSPSISPSPAARLVEKMSPVRVPELPPTAEEIIKNTLGLAGGDKLSSKESSEMEPRFSPPEPAKLGPTERSSSSSRLSRPLDAALTSKFQSAIGPGCGVRPLSGTRTTQPGESSLLRKFTAQNVYNFNSSSSIATLKSSSSSTVHKISKRKKTFQDCVSSHRVTEVNVYPGGGLDSDNIESNFDTVTPKVESNFLIVYPSESEQFQDTNFRPPGRTANQNQNPTSTSNIGLTSAGPNYSPNVRRGCKFDSTDMLTKYTNTRSLLNANEEISTQSPIQAPTKSSKTTLLAGDQSHLTASERRKKKKQRRKSARKARMSQDSSSPEKGPSPPAVRGRSPAQTLVKGGENFNRETESSSSATSEGVAGLLDNIAYNV